LKEGSEDAKPPGPSASSLVIACALLLIVALVGYFLRVVLSWFLRVVVPMAWS